MPKTAGCALAGVPACPSPSTSTSSPSSSSYPVASGGHGSCSSALPVVGRGLRLGELLVGGAGGGVGVLCGGVGPVTFLSFDLRGVVPQEVFDGGVDLAGVLFVSEDALFRLAVLCKI